MNGDGLGLTKRELEASPTIKVEIYDQAYTVRSDGDPEYLKQLAEYVDQRMREISSGTLTVDSRKVAILAALYIADELHQLRKAARAGRRTTGHPQRRMLRDARSVAESPAQTWIDQRASSDLHLAAIAN